MCIWENGKTNIKKCDQINLKQQKLHSIPNFNS